MCRSTWVGVAWCVSFSGVAQAEPVEGAEPLVRIRCPAFSEDEVAELEARTRATLLTEPERGVDVLVDCAANAASIVVSAGDHSETALVTLTERRNQEVVLAVIERLITRLASSLAPATTSAPAATSSTTTPVPAATEPAGTKPPVAPSAPPAPPKAKPVPPSATESDGRRSFLRRASASLMLAQFSDVFASGGRAAIEAGVTPWSAGIALGGVTAHELDNAFVPAEWHGVVFGSVDDRSWTALRFSLGFGASVLTASPSRGVIARSSTAITGAFAELGVARPFRFEQFAIVPALGLRVFPAKRSVLIEGKSRFELPIATVAGLLGASYEF